MDRIQLGYVARAHGLRGEVRVHLHAEESTTLFDVDRVWIGGVERVVESIRPTVGGLLLTIEGVNDRDTAEALKGQPIEVLREDIPLDEGEYLIGDLPGCLVVDESGHELGRVVSLIQAAQPILVIHGEGVERLLPALPNFIVSVDAVARRIVVSPPEGLPTEPIEPG